MSMNGSSSISAHFVSKFRFHRASSIRPSALKTRRSRPGNWLVYFWHVAARWSLDFFSMYKIIESVDKLSETNGINHCQCAAKSFPQERAPATNSTSTLAPLVAWMQTWYIVRRSKKIIVQSKDKQKTRFITCIDFKFEAVRSWGSNSPVNPSHVWAKPAQRTGKNSDLLWSFGRGSVQTLHDLRLP